jgi:hypothetical protein
MTEQPKAPKAPAHGGIGTLISPSAIIVAALVAATTALIRPYLEISTESTLFVVVFLYQPTDLEMVKLLCHPGTKPSDKVLLI